MNLDGRAVKAYHFHVDLDDALRLQGGKYSTEHPVLAPSVHANINCMPIPIGFRQCPPFAAVFRDIQNRIYQLEVAHTDVPALCREILCYPLVLLLCNLHAPIIPVLLFIVNSVNTL